MTRTTASTARRAWVRCDQTARLQQCDIAGNVDDHVHRQCGNHGGQTAGNGSVAPAVSGVGRVGVRGLSEVQGAPCTEDPEDEDRQRNERSKQTQWQVEAFHRAQHWQADEIAKQRVQGDVQEPAQCQARQELEVRHAEDA